MANSEINYSTGSNRPAIGGSGVTVMKWQNEVIGFCNGVTVNWPTAVATEIAVQPLDAIRPVEIVTARAIGMGTIQLTLTNLYNQQIWDRLKGLAGANDLADIFAYIQTAYYEGGAGTDRGLTIQRAIYPTSSKNLVHVEQFEGCVVTSVADGVNITNASMTIDRQLTVAFKQHRKLSNFTKQNEPVPNIISDKIDPSVTFDKIKSFFGA